MKLAELVNHYRAKLDILSDAVLIGEIPEGIDEIPDELKSTMKIHFAKTYDDVSKLVFVK